MVQEQGINELGLFDIYKPWHVPFWHTTPFYVALALGILGLLILAWFVYKNYFRRAPLESSWQKALAAIERLRSNNKATAEHGKEFYYALTSILKRYMHERYGFEGREKTDQEFLQYLEEQKFTPLFMHDFTQIFEGSTIIKFANAAAAQQQIDRDLAAAISFIKKTIPAPAEK